MYFRKYPHIANFDFARRYQPGKPLAIGKQAYTLEATEHRDGVFRIALSGGPWKRNLSQAGLTRPLKAGKVAGRTATLTLDAQASLSITLPGNRPLLTSPAGMTFGVCGERSMFVFEQPDGAQFYGMGEKMLGLELSGIQTKFWNTDIFADFHWNEISSDRPDPMYLSIPYLIIKQDNRYVGLLLDNPHAAFISTSAGIQIAGGQMDLGGPDKQYTIIGAEAGMPDLTIVVGPSLPELTRKLQRIVGLTPLPPVWALGYHQCRWGYKSEACVNQLDKGFTEHGIPCDGLWIDIDYMQDFKVFTMNPDLFPDAAKTLKKLANKGRRLVPIIDPGVKRQKGYPVYESGLKAKAYCLNPQGGVFTGLVWPGETAFPDFSMPKARDWWANHTATFAKAGFDGVWIDMNDPSTGTVLNEDMLFNQGNLPHHAYHNQYANGMAQATRAGLEAANPDKRVFLISRSGFTGISKYSAIWTGDNMANYHYLRNCIAVSLNLALSGVPFNGPDIGGFAGDTTPGLISDWVKCCFLFPFCRNHTMIGTRDQEPWAFDAKTRDLLKHYIQLRYKLRPYLYNLFVQQAADGEAILRPLFYQFEDTPDLPLGRIDDQFMVGPALMQAPVLDEHNRSRAVVLPGGTSWYDVMHGTWRDGGITLDKVEPGPRQTPVYMPDGSILPMSQGGFQDAPGYDLRKADIHVFLRPGANGSCVGEYVFDDGETLAYREGKRSALVITATETDGHLDIRTEQVLNGFGRGSFRFVVYDRFAKVTVNGKPARLTSHRWTFAGTPQRAYLVQT